MSSETRYVFDANVIISAMLFNDSVPGQAFSQSFDRGAVLLSHTLAKELNDVLGRAKFKRYVTLQQRERFLEALFHESEFVEIKESVQKCRDPKDDHILELAVNGEASFIVTGDSDLLVMNPFRGTQIVTPAKLLEWMDEQST